MKTVATILRGHKRNHQAKPSFGSYHVISSNTAPLPKERWTH